jgi:hypothetical protein
VEAQDLTVETKETEIVETATMEIGLGDRAADRRGVVPDLERPLRVLAVYGSLIYEVDRAVFGSRSFRISNSGLVDVEAGERSDRCSEVAVVEKLHQGDDIAVGTATSAVEHSLCDADGEPVGASTSRAASDQFTAVSFETKTATTGDFVFDAHRFRGVKDHSEACAPSGAPYERNTLQFSINRALQARLLLSPAKHIGGVFDKLMQFLPLCLLSLVLQQACQL